MAVRVATGLSCGGRKVPAYMEDKIHCGYLHVCNECHFTTGRSGCHHQWLCLAMQSNVRVCTLFLKRWVLSVNTHTHTYTRVCDESQFNDEKAGLVDMHSPVMVVSCDAAVTHSTVLGARRTRPMARDTRLLRPVYTHTHTHGTVRYGRQAPLSSAQSLCAQVHVCVCV